MKKILLVTTILLMTLVLCSCSKEDKESSVYSEPMSTAMTSDESQLQISSATATDSSDNTDISDTSSQKTSIINDADIRNLKWGMSLDDVKTYETEKNFTETVDNKDSSKTLLTYHNVPFDGYDTEMTLCVIEGKGLEGVNYRITGDRYDEIYNKIYEEYGKPSSEYDDPSSASWTIESNGYIIFLLRYSEDDTVITQYSFFPASEDDNNESSDNSETRPSASSATLGEQNALKMAINYLNVIPLSYKGLIEQLEFEGFSESEATYGADYCGADWYEQAALKAKQYLESLALSRSRLIEQLVFEGFTHSQAVYGAEYNGY